MRGSFLAIAIALGTTSSGCLRSSLVEARVSAAVDSEASLDTLHDYEVGQVGAMARIATLEALFSESAGDTRVAVLLARAWCKLSSEFTLDAYEQALESGDGALASYHQSRARAGYQRALFYADIWLERRAPGFGAALSSDDALGHWLETKLDRADAAEALLWAGTARVGYANSAGDAADATTARRAGARLLSRSLALDPGVARGAAHIGLALAAAKSEPRDLVLLERELGAADAAARGARLFVPLIRARALACQKHDHALFERELGSVLGARDPDPLLRLENAAAKRRARRYLTSGVIGAECFDAKG